MRLRLVAAAAVIAAAVPALAFGSASATKLTAKLSGGVEVPKGSPAGKGTAAVTITGTKVCWKFTYSGIDAPLASHIHKGAPGKAGAVVVPLGGAFKASGCASAPAAVAKAIAANPGGYYVNIHTKRYQAGALRGQLSVASGY